MHNCIPGTTPRKRALLPPVQGLIASSTCNKSDSGTDTPRLFALSSSSLGLGRHQNIDDIDDKPDTPARASGSCALVVDISPNVTG
ncbi:hypothetical protein CMUS01_06375 [Colletotrichum musicola]|uniref:Uncharacterized protein n=1 Tax=Colletotrichum musicola TaxID=2175873 RepID=A0A8H6KMD6_9PEZI|nr:hypothetical protein CMUS01_06375 [Colletotrichum musicola]